MKITPLRNALLAIGYIVFVVLLLSTFVDNPVEHRAPLLVPITMLSLLTLSVAVMGYLFVYQPLCMYIDGEKKAGAKLFLQTVGIFAGITAVILLVLSLQ